MENQKRNAGLYIIIAILTVLVLLLGGYIAYDKFQSSKNIETSKGNELSDVENNQLNDVEEDTENTEGFVYDGVTIPAGFKVSNKIDEKSKEKGLVIIDSNGNEFVWIPVENINEMIMCQGHTETSDCDIVKQNGKLVCKIHNELICGKLYNAYTTADKSFNSKLDSQIYKNSDIKEPAIAIGDEQYCYTVLNFENVEQFKNSMQENFEKMALSVYDNKGFYIGRYEMGNSSNTISKKGSLPTSTCEKETNTWYGLYSMAKSYSTSSVESQMIWGCQYDMVARWLEKSGYNIENSTEWGNYQDASFKYLGSDGKEHIKYASVEDKDYKGFDVKYNILDENNNICYYEIANPEETKTYDKDGNLLENGLDQKYYTSVKIPTGSSEHNKANNIYDMAGNMSEWTQEMLAGYRSVRGGSFGSNGYADSVTARKIGGSSSGKEESSIYDNWGTRITLLLK